MGGPEGCLTAAASGANAPALRTARGAALALVPLALVPLALVPLALVPLALVRIEVQGVLDSQQDA
ncbi:hypothetical protein K4B79_20535 [Streptomyces lincolnensis]|uniref:hypothetical protein n=1 Tax=Streptomyces lincolnensis TaxID=1915 RepID=UPI001E2A9ED3|nr:hypothetical protein [Streptomyces lincolnensis]MCD7440600.1 hypothetical protein [Streptomyces lincolnensis]